MTAVERPYVIGVTGNIACGKSTVMGRLAELGAATIDADAVYHELIAPDKPLWRALKRRFGDQIIAADGAIDRRALGRIVFSDPARLAELDTLTHPAVIAEIRTRVRASQAPVVAVDAVKLIESGLDDACDQVWLVVCDRARQVGRLIQRDGLSHEDALRRIDAQPAIDEKLKRADVVIDNNGSVEATRTRVERAWRTLRRRRTGALPRHRPTQEGDSSRDGPGVARSSPS